MVWTSCPRKLLRALLQGERDNTHAPVVQQSSAQHKRPATPLSGGFLFLLSKGQNSRAHEHTLLDLSLVA